MENKDFNLGSVKQASFSLSILIKALGTIATIVTLLLIIVKNDDPNSRIMYSVFFLFGVFIFGYLISLFLKKTSLAIIFEKIIVSIFLVFWFGLLIIASFALINQGENPSILIMTIPFWLVGLYFFYAKIIKLK